MDYKTLLKKYSNENYFEFKKNITELPAEKVFENTCKINAYNIILDTL